MCSAESTPADPNGGGGPKTPDPATSRNPNRRSNKPIMEKRRRARINNCLNELKAILLEAMRKDPARHSKLEKADILELTVSHLKSLHSAGSPSTNGEGRFRAGFTECANEVGRFLSSPKAQGIDPLTSGRLLSHLSDCLNGPGVGTGPPAPEHLHSHPTSVTATSLNVPPNMPVISLVPSRLSSGEIAFVVPGFSSSSLRAAAAAAGATHMPPLLSPEVPLELTVGTSSGFGSNSSPSSSSSNSSLSPAYPGTAYQYSFAGYGHSPAYGQPLALVTPKREEAPDMSCWRPW